MKILITGGHFSPAQAVISILKEHGHEIAVAGRRHPFEGDKSESYEYEVVRRENIRFYEVRAGRFQRKFTAYSAASLLKTPASYINALGIIRDFKPDVVLTFGGYIGLPISYAARTLGIPIVLHEQTQNAGLASKMIAKIAAKVLVAYETSERLFPKGKTILTGNPLRSDIFRIEAKIEIPPGKVIYITGGSTGSHFINTQMAKIVPEICRDFVLIHQTGENKFNDYEKLVEVAQALPPEVKKNYIVKKFVSEDEIGFVLKSADLVVARSGINTVSEILALEKICLLIPLPSGQRNEQLENARMVKKLGVGEFIDEKDATPAKIMDVINSIFEKFWEYKKNSEAAKKTIKLNADRVIVEILEKNYGDA